MNSSSEIRLAPPSGLANGCGPHTSPIKPAAIEANRIKFAGQRIKTLHNNEINGMFEKCYNYNKSPTWHLPKAEELFKEYYQFDQLQQLAEELNAQKSKLNDYVIEDWSKHTRRQDPAGEVPFRLKSQTKAEFVTVAWCKMYECLSRFPELVAGPQLNSLHLCEAPGAFVAALNHYLCSKYDQEQVQWNWLATTLNPYYEGNPLNKMITDDRLMLYTLKNWLFHGDFTGNIIDSNNLEHMRQQCAERMGDVHLITADGSVDCVEDPAMQEENVSLLHFSEIVSALTILAAGGSFIVKKFTLFEAASVCKMFLLNCVFQKVHVFKPCTSRRGNSEVYLVCINYQKQAENLQEILSVLREKLKIENSIMWPLFPKACLPKDFLMQHEVCSRTFMHYQINAIQANIHAYEYKPTKQQIRQLQTLRTAVCDEYYQRYNIKCIPEDMKVLAKCKQYEEKYYTNKIYRGSFKERELLKEASREQQLFKLKTNINDLEKIIWANNELEGYISNAIQSDGRKMQLTVQRGQAIRTLHSSLFVNVHLLVMRSKLLKVFEQQDPLWCNEAKCTFTNDSTHSILYKEHKTDDGGSFSKQEKSFFKTAIEAAYEHEPKQLHFENMPFVTHFSVSILKYLFSNVYSDLSISQHPNFIITLSGPSKDFKKNLQQMHLTLQSNMDGELQDILCLCDIFELHRNDFNTSLKTYNNMLLLNNFKLMFDH